MNWYLSVLKKYSEFNGRSRRSEYWYFVLISAIISAVLATAGNILKFRLLDSLYTLAVLLPSIAVGVRRMHDINKSGWYSIIPIYNIILAFTDGTQGPNNYGSDPKRPEIYDEIDQIGTNQL